MDTKNIINTLVERKNLSESQATYAMKLMMTGEMTHSQIGSFLTALRLKGETEDEITYMAKEMRKFSKKINPKMKDVLIDTCGTGGDRVNTFNVSTISAFVLSGAGIYVAKHGNRSVTSKCGSADLLEGLGVKIDIQPDIVEKCIQDSGIGFMFAPIFHPSMKNVVKPRKEIGLRTVFNVLGPLTNPANAEVQLLGVYDEELTYKIGKVLKKLGVKKACVVHGEGGIDEITITGKTRITEVEGNDIKCYTIDPRDFGFDLAKEKDILGGELIDNVKITTNILNGDLGPKTDMVILNSAVGLSLSGKAQDIKEGVEIARDIIKNGKALKKLIKLIKVSGGNTEEIRYYLEG